MMHPAGPVHVLREDRWETVCGLFPEGNLWNPWGGTTDCPLCMERLAQRIEAVLGPRQHVEQALKRAVKEVTEYFLSAGRRTVHGEYEMRLEAEILEAAIEAYPELRESFPGDMVVSFETRQTGVRVTLKVKPLKLVFEARTQIG